MAVSQDLINQLTTLKNHIKSFIELHENPYVAQRKAQLYRVQSTLQISTTRLWMELEGSILFNYYVHYCISVGLSLKWINLFIAMTALKEDCDKIVCKCFVVALRWIYHLCFSFLGIIISVCASSLKTWKPPILLNNLVVFIYMDDKNLRRV